MNNEIKEILDILKNCKDYDDEVFLIKQHSATLLLNYINDLQQRNNNLKEDFKRHIDRINELTEKSDNLQQENEIRQQDINNLTYQLAKIKEENERLKELNENASKVCMAEHKYGVDKAEEARDYKSRCEKVIEYNYELQERYCHSAIFDELVASKIYEITEKELNILQNGSEKDE